MRNWSAKPQRASQEHSQIIEHLRVGDKEAAAKILEEHWHEGIRTVTAWIDEQGPQLEVDDG
jgi:DNA-binding GntR family transcriptional regulator